MSVRDEGVEGRAAVWAGWLVSCPVCPRFEDEGGVQPCLTLARVQLFAFACVFQPCRGLIWPCLVLSRPRRVSFRSPARKASSSLADAAASDT